MFQLLLNARNTAIYSVKKSGISWLFSSKMRAQIKCRPSWYTNIHESPGQVDKVSFLTHAASFSILYVFKGSVQMVASFWSRASCLFYLFFIFVVQCHRSPPLGLEQACHSCHPRLITHNDPVHVFVALIVVSLQKSQFCSHAFGCCVRV